MTLLNGVNPSDAGCNKPEFTKCSISVSSDASMHLTVSVEVDLDNSDVSKALSHTLDFMFQLMSRATCSLQALFEGDFAVNLKETLGLDDIFVTTSPFESSSEVNVYVINESGEGVS